MSALRRLDRGHDLRRGVILVLVSGVSVLLLFTAMLLLQYGLFAAKGSASKVSGAQARLAALSGMDYASSRLAGGVYKRWSTTPLDRGDDWTERQGAGGSGQGSDNPSYSHGESWADDGDGIYEPGEPFADLDRDGRLTSSSGRLRGQGAPSFSLRLAAPSAGIPVNAGNLDAGASGSLTYPYHRGLARCLNNLGTLLLPDGSFRRADAAAGTAGADRIRVCWIGRDLLLNRPAGGYRSADGIRSALLGAGYDIAQVEAVLPFMDLGPYPDAADRGSEAASTAVLSTAPVNLSTASVEVLEALWTYVACGVLSADLPYGAWNRWFRRSGSSNVRFDGTAGPGGYGMTVAIWPDEAEALASAAHELRRSRAYSWKAFRDKLVGEAAALFSREYADLDMDADGDGDPATNPGPAQTAWARAKADLAFFAVSPDPAPLSPSTGIWSAAGYDGRPDLTGDQPLSSVICPRMGEIRYPPYPNVAYDAAAGEASWPFAWPAGSLTSAPGGIPTISPVRLAMTPPVRFSVASLGRSSRASATMEGELLAAETIELSSQEDFENLRGTAWLERRGIGVLDPDPLSRGAWILDPARGKAYPQVKSYPRSNASRHPGRPYSGLYGGVMLADREIGPRGARYYYPFAKSYPGLSEDLFLDEPLATTGIPVLPSNELGANSGSGPWWATRAWISDLHVSGWTPFSVPAPMLPPEHLTRASYELWIHPFPYYDSQVPPKKPGANRHWLKNLKLGGSIEDESGNTHTGWILIQSRRAGPGKRTELRVIVDALTKKIIYPSLYNDIVRPSPPLSIPDHDAAGGSVRTGHIHVALTLEQIPGLPKVHFRLYVDGAMRDEWDYPDTADVAKMSLPRKPYFLEINLQAADELRLYDRTLSSTEVKEHYDLGRFVPPSGPAAADLSDLLRSPPAAPANPTYRSPAYDLGAGASLHLAQWTGWSSRSLESRVRPRLAVFGLDADGSVVDGAEIPTSGQTRDCGLRGARSFRYAVEFYSPTGGDPGPLYDTPVFESVWFTVLRRGISPGWGAWQAR